MRTSSPPAAVLRQFLALRRRLAADAVRDAEHEAAVTGLTALEFADAGLVPFDPKLHILVARGFDGRRIPGVRYERTRRPPEPLPLRLPPTAPYARAVVDACRRLAREQDARSVVLGSVRTRLCDPAAIAAECERLPARERTRLAPLLAEARVGLRSVPEADLRRAITRSELPEPLWNPHVSARDGAFLGRPDALWPDEGVAAEVDSVVYHGSPRDQARTAARRARLEAAGLLVLPILPREIRDEPRRVVALLRDTLRRAGAETAAGGRTAHRALVVQHAMW